MNSQNISVARVLYPYQSGESALSAPDSQQLLIHSVSAYNASEAAAGIGIGHSVSQGQWEALTDINSVETNVTELAQAGSAFTLLGINNGDSALFLSKNKFGLLSFSVSQIETGSPVYDYEYWNGSSFAALPLLVTPVYTVANRQILMFNAPLDWAVDGDGYYAVRITATTAPSQAVIVSDLKVIELLIYRDYVKPKGELQIEFKERQLLLQAKEEIIPFFSFSYELNTIETAYQINP